MTRSQLGYSSHPLTGMNAVDGMGRSNSEGAVELSQQVRSELLYSNQFGAPLLYNSAPPPNSNIAGFSFSWSAADQWFIRGRSRAVRRRSYDLHTKSRGNNRVCMPAVRETTFSQSTVKIP